MMTHVLCIADKYNKEEVHLQNNPNNTPRYKAECLYRSWETKYNIPELIVFYFNQEAVL